MVVIVVGCSEAYGGVFSHRFVDMALKASLTKGKIRDFKSNQDLIWS